MLRIHYFASVREAMGRADEQLEMPSGIATVAGLITYLRSADPDFDRMCADHEQVLVAVNQAVAGQDSAISEEDEIAFFPPMSGG